MIASIIRVFLLALSHSWIVNGYHTGKCNHEKFATQTHKYLTCMKDELVESTDHVLTDYRNQIYANDYVYNATNGCSIFMKSKIELRHCRTAYLDPCFDEHPTKLEDELFDVITKFCDTNFDLKKIGMWGEEVEDKLEDKTVKEIKEFLSDFDKNDVLKTDKNCSSEEWDHAFENDLESKRCDDTVNEFGVAIVSPLFTQNTPMHLSLCTAFANSVGSCLKVNNCASKREVELIHELLWMAYRIPMEMLVKVKSKFGSLHELRVKLGLTTFQFGNLEISPQDDQNIFPPGEWERYQIYYVDIIVKGIIDDYETHACKALVDHGLHGLDVITPKPTPTTAHKSHVAVWLCSITLVIVLIVLMYLVATRTEIGNRMYDRLRG